MYSLVLGVVLLLLGILLVLVLHKLAKSPTNRRDVIEIRYKQKDTYCDVWSPQLPGASAGGSYLNPALVSFLRQHGEKLGVVLVEVPYP